MKNWRIVFMGTPTFAVPILTALLNGPDQVVGVFTQPDKPTGRGMTVSCSPVKQTAINHAMPVFQPFRLKDPAIIADLITLQPDLIVVVAYGQILPDTILTLPRLGCINVHASLLPRWRGAAPIHRALLAGDVQSGISIMQMDAGLDTGPILAIETCPITPTTTGGQLHDALSLLGARLLMQTITGLKANTIHPICQPSEGVTYAAKLTRNDEKIDFNTSAQQVQRHILALNPWPGAVALWLEKPIKIFQCRTTTTQSNTPGILTALHNDGPEIACGTGSIIPTEVQLPGKRRMSAIEWMRGHALEIGCPWR